MVDISNPRNVHPDVGKLDRVFLYDIDALESIADQNRVRRRREIPKVEGIVVEEVDRSVAGYQSLDMVPVIRALRGRFQEIAEKEMQRQVKNFDRADQEALKEYTRALINKLLHQPMALIRGVEPSTRHGIHKLVASFNPEFQERLRNNIILSGGGGMLDGLILKLEEGLETLGGGHVTHVDEPMYAGAAGALQLAMDMPGEFWEQLR